ncbi:MAG: Ryanodine receptor Ryr [Planctomycetes bacterium]|nr:Ryanodine receptor Ryr [Planctomycetota bacterium]
MRYTPRPIDTAGVELPTGIGSLVERLAKHNHDVWARQRLKDGWSFGPVRNDDRKEHPCLVPYADLPESEKDYDRKTALEALKAIVALGYRIVPADEAGAE